MLPTLERPVKIPRAGGVMAADLTVPDKAGAIVVFAHGAGSSRLSPRNRQVAYYMRERGLATLLLDLLSMDEEADEERGGRLRFDVEMLADRLTAATRWAAEQRELSALPLAYFGASTGAAAALIAAADQPDVVSAVVSRGGRPDLAGHRLAEVSCPTLLIVGGNDPLVLDLNRRALSHLRARSSLEIVPGATHLFEEPGALEVVAELATDWVGKHAVTDE